jgi:3-oxoacyl-[acyl-carrier-protein] synthase-1
VVITGVGLVSCLGHDYETVLESLQQGQSGVRRVPDDWLGRGLKSLVAGTIEDLEDKQAQARISKKLIPGMSDAARYCCIAAHDAVSGAGWSEDQLQSNDTICIVGTGVGSVVAVQKAAHLYYADRIRRVDPYTVFRHRRPSRGRRW